MTEEKDHKKLISSYKTDNIVPEEKRIIRSKVKRRPYSSYKKRMKRNISIDQRNSSCNSITRDSEYITNVQNNMIAEDKVNSPF